MLYSYKSKFSVDLKENRPHTFGADHANDQNFVQGKGAIDFTEKNDKCHIQISRSPKSAIVSSWSAKVATRPKNGFILRRITRFIRPIFLVIWRGALNNLKFTLNIHIKLHFYLFCYESYRMFYTHDKIDRGWRIDYRWAKCLWNKKGYDNKNKSWIFSEFKLNQRTYFNHCLSLFMPHKLCGIDYADIRIGLFMTLNC